jgi:hypothetical protein
MDTFHDFVNLQKEVLNLLLSQKKEYEQIGRINLDIEKRVGLRRQSESKMMDLIQTKMIENEGLMRLKAKATSDTAKDSIDRLLKANKRTRDDTNQLLAMSREANTIEMDMAKRKYDYEHRYFTLASTQMQKLFGFKVEEYDLTKSIGEELIKVGVRGEMIAYTWGGIIMMLKGAYDLFNKFDKAAQTFRMSMGMTRVESEVIRKDAQRIAIDYMAMGVTIEGVYKSYQALGGAVGGVHNVSKSLVETVAIMAAQLGVSEEISTRFLRNMAVISKSSMESQTSSMYIAQYMAAAAGVPFPQVMEDVSKATAQTLLLMSRVPNVVLRSTIELRRMGTSMNDAARSGAHVLDFTQSINEEMEASVLLGTSINMQRVRELAYSRNLEGSTKEILRLAQQHGFATKMDYFQMKAFAQMTGFSVDQLLSMVQTSEQINAIRRRGTPEQQTQLKLYEQMRQENEAAAKAKAIDSSALLRTMNNQTRLVAISSKWNQILARVQEYLFPIIDKMFSGIIWAMDIGKYLAPVIGQMYTAYTIGGDIVESLIKISNYTGRWGGMLRPIHVFFRVLALNVSRVWHSVLAIGDGLSSFGKYFKFLKGLESLKVITAVGKSLGKFTVILNVIFAVWNVLKAIFHGAKNFVEGFMMLFEKGKFLAGLGKMLHGLIQITIGSILGALEGVFGFVVDIPILLLKGLGWAFGGATKKFADMVSGWWDSIKDWLGFSPSKVGLLIVKGITSIGGMLFRALTSPFRMAFSWIVDKFSHMGRSIKGLFGKGNSVEKKATAAYIPAVTVTPNGTKIETAKEKTKRAGEKEKEELLLMTEETGCKMVALLEKILAKDTNVNMDGQLLSVHLARQTEFRGGYGVNKVA